MTDPHLTTKDGVPAVVISLATYAIFPDAPDTVMIARKTQVADLTRADFRTHEKFGSAEAAKAEIADLVTHERQRADHVRLWENSAIWTPWGKAQDVMRYADGVNFYSTPGHGGFKLAPRLNDTVPEVMRNSDGWYEEDSEQCKVVLAFPDLFTDREQRLARNVLKNWYPDAYEAMFNVTLAPGESRERDRQVFEETHKGDLVVHAARGRDDGMVLCWARKATDPETSIQFLVHKDEYAKRSPFGFVIDETRHERFEPESAQFTP